MLQPSSSSPTPPRSTSPTSGNERARDSAYVAPYLTHVVRHHGQLTLIPPENAGRLRKKGKKKSRSRLREEHYDETTLSPPSPLSGPGAAHSLHASHTLSRPRPILMHAARSEVGTSSTPGTSITGTANRSVQCYEDMHIPDFPPPSFEEATSSHIAQQSSTISRPSILVSQSSPSTQTHRRPDTPADDPDIDHHADTSSTSSFELLEDLVDKSQQDWDDDRKAGLSLEERVRREFTRRQQAEVSSGTSGPQASSSKPTPPTKLRKCDVSVGFNIIDFTRDMAERAQAPVGNSHKGKARATSTTNLRTSSRPSPQDGQLPAQAAYYTDHLFHEDPVPSATRRKLLSEIFNAPIKGSAQEENNGATNHGNRKIEPCQLTHEHLQHAPETSLGSPHSLEPAQSSRGNVSVKASPSLTSHLSQATNSGTNGKQHVPSRERPSSVSLPQVSANHNVIEDSPSLSPASLSTTSCIIPRHSTTTVSSSISASTSSSRASPTPGFATQSVDDNQPIMTSDIDLPTPPHPPRPAHARPIPPVPPSRPVGRRPPPPVPRPRPLSTSALATSNSSTIPYRREESDSTDLPRRRRPPPPPPPRRRPSTFHETRHNVEADLMPSDIPRSSPGAVGLRRGSPLEALPVPSIEQLTPPVQPEPPNVDGSALSNSSVELRDNDAMARREDVLRSNVVQPERQNTDTLTVDDAAGVTLPSPPVQVPLQTTFTELTDLDLLLARLDANEDALREGLSYDALLAISNFIGPALPSDHTSSSLLSAIPVGHVELARRRVMHDGRVKVKLSLFGVSVDKCRICLAQFKPDSLAGMLGCQHVFHSQCLQSWFVRNASCPLCRTPVQTSE